MLTEALLRCLWHSQVFFFATKMSLTQSVFGLKLHSQVFFFAMKMSLTVRVWNEAHPWQYTPSMKAAKVTHHFCIYAS